MIVGPIYSIAANGKQRIWHAELVMFSKHGDTIEIDSLDMEIPEGAYVEYTTMSGIVGMKMTKSEPTRVDKGKNIGKKNETNVLQQAHSTVTSKMNVKIKAGYTFTNSQQQQQHSIDKFPFAMAVKNVKDHPDKVKYPVHLQCKLDGIRAVASFINGEVIMKTRRLHDIVGFEDLKEELKKLFIAYKNTDGLFIDGELYSHGMSLQTISGIVRGSDISRKHELQYHVFDAFRVEGMQHPFEDRLLELTSFTENANTNLIVQVDTVIAHNQQDADDFYNQHRDLGYEGAIYKPFGKPYEWSYTREKRSGWYLKRKAVMDSEYQIVGYDEGEGKDAGCIVFKFITQQGLNFSAVPNMPYAVRKQLYEKANQDFEQFRGQLMTVQYEDLSDENVPLRARAKAFRDLSFD